LRRGNYNIGVRNGNPILTRLALFTPAFGLHLLLRSDLSRLLNSFRVRLLLLWPHLMLNPERQYTLTAIVAANSIHRRTTQAIMAGVALGVNSLSSGLYLDQMREQAKQPLLGEQSERVKNV